MENKTSKYFKYALGEIVLVVIGILIALQINTWNENRKLENEELNLLKELKSNLEATLEDFDEVTDYNYNTVSFYNNINYYVENDLPYHKELDSAFAAITLWSSPFAITTAYKSLQNKGLDIIKNKHLKNSIIDLYDVQLQSLTVDIDQAEWTLNQSVILPFFSKNIRRLNSVSLNSSSPNNFETLKQNNEFINILSMLIRQRRKSLEYFETIMAAIEDVITEIETELKSRT
jgi:hypothetical protein